MNIAWSDAGRVSCQLLQIVATAAHTKTLEVQIQTESNRIKQ